MTDRYFMTWAEVYKRCREIMPRAAVVYGVPRGGAIVAGIMQAINSGVRVTDDPALADLIVDDIVDSGATRMRYVSKYPDAEFFGIVDKASLTGDRDLGWVVFPWEGRDETADIEDTVIRQLEFIGENPSREGLKDTPRRFIKALCEMTEGLHQDPKEPLARVFDEDHDEVVAVKDINFTSLCEHHLLPFTGVVHFAYVPSGKIVGLSKIPRMVKILAHRPQVQERLATQIVDTFCEVLTPVGAMAVVEGDHSCMKCRGVRSTGSMVTSVVRGCFKDKPEARAEALSLMGFK